MKDYEAYFESKNDIKIGEEMEVQLRDRDTFEEINVKAVISDKKEGEKKKKVKTSLGQRRGFMIQSMIEERQKK